MQLPHIRIFLGVRFLEDPTKDLSEGENEESNDERILTLSRSVPSLELIDHWSAGSVAHIKRNAKTGEVTWKERPGDIVDSMLEAYFDGHVP